MAHLQDWRHEVEWLEAAAIWAREPGLSGRLSHGLYFPNAHQVRDPLVLVRRLAKAFEARGGEIRLDRVEGLVPTPNGVTLQTSEANLAYDKVVAAGACSLHLA